MRREAHRLDGIEADNLLAFLALLGLLRALEEARPAWCARAAWTVDAPPLRAEIHVPEGTTGEAVAQAAGEGVSALGAHHDVGGRLGIGMSPQEARAELQHNGHPQTQALWSALACDAAVTRDARKTQPPPLCLMFGAGHQHFLERIEGVVKTHSAPARNGAKGGKPISETQCMREALLAPWRRLDKTFSFRWDPEEDVRHALRARRPSDPKTKETTQHGANRLAAIGFTQLAMMPRTHRGRLRAEIAGGEHTEGGGFVFRWPIWRHPMRLAAVRALLGHPQLEARATRDALGVVAMMRTERVDNARTLNVTRATAQHSHASG